MATPVGHSLIGLAVGHVGAERSWWRCWPWYAFVVVCANAADLDFVPGLLVGEPNRYHHLATHSLTAAIVFGALVGLVAMRFHGRPLRIGVVGALIYASHLLGDYLTVDQRAPYGIPLFWPFADGFYIAPVTPLSAVQHGLPGDGNAAVLTHIFSPHNVATIAVELALLVPLFAVVGWLRWRRRAA